MFNYYPNGKFHSRVKQVYRMYVYVHVLYFSYLKLFWIFFDPMPPSSFLANAYVKEGSKKASCGGLRQWTMAQ